MKDGEERERKKKEKKKTVFAIFNVFHFSSHILPEGKREGKERKRRNRK